MMKVLIDDQVFGFQRFGGVSRYYVELIQGLRKLPDVEVFFKLFYSDNQYVGEHGLKSLPSFLRGKSFPGRNRIYDLLIGVNRKQNIRKLKNGQFDIFHPTYYETYYLDMIETVKKPFGCGNLAEYQG